MAEAIWQYQAKGKGKNIVFNAKGLAANGTVDKESLPGTRISIHKKDGGTVERVVKEVLEEQVGEQNTQWTVSLEEQRQRATWDGWQFVRGKGKQPDALGVLEQAEAEGIQEGSRITVRQKNGGTQTRTVGEVLSSEPTEEGSRIEIRVSLADEGGARSRPGWKGWGFVKGKGKGYDGSASCPRPKRKRWPQATRWRSGRAQGGSRSARSPRWWRWRTPRRRG